MKMILNAPVGPHVGFAPQPPPPPPIPPPPHGHTGLPHHQPGPQPPQFVYCAQCPAGELPGPPIPISQVH